MRPCVRQDIDHPRQSHGFAVKWNSFRNIAETSLSEACQRYLPVNFLWLSLAIFNPVAIFKQHQLESCTDFLGRLGQPRRARPQRHGNHLDSNSFWIKKSATTLMNRNKIFEILPDVLANAGERLTSLLLRNNYIRKLHPRCFFGQINLEELDLSNNFLNSLPPNRFQDLHSLRVLFVFRNNIHTISTLVGVQPALIIWIDRNRNCSSFDLGSNITCRPVQARNAYAKIFILEDRFDDCSSSTCFDATCSDLTGSFTCKHPATEFTKRIICRE